MSTLITVASSFSCLILSPTSGKSFLNSLYKSSSYFRQHKSLPHNPLILLGFNDKFWFFTWAIPTESRSFRKLEQHNFLPHWPIPEISFALSLTPTCLNSIRVLYIAANDFASSLKSTLLSEILIVFYQMWNMHLKISFQVITFLLILVLFPMLFLLLLYLFHFVLFLYFWQFV